MFLITYSFLHHGFSVPHLGYDIVENPVLFAIELTKYDDGEYHIVNVMHIPDELLEIAKEKLA
jgi:hypothetical protein